MNPLCRSKQICLRGSDRQGVDLRRGARICRGNKFSVASTRQAGTQRENRH